MRSRLAGVEIEGLPRRHLCAAGLACAIAGLARADNTPQQADASSSASVSSHGAASAPFVAQQLRTGLFLLSDENGNALLRFTPLGSVMVDATASSQYRALMSQVRRLSRFTDHPVRGLILTSAESRHAGAAPQFLASGATIVTHRRVSQRLGESVAAQARSAVPFVTFEHEHALKMAGVDVQIRFVGPAHSDGDSVVHFPHLRVLAVGDLFAPAGPCPNYDAGGSLLGWSRALAQALMFDVDTIVPGQGPVVARIDLENMKARLDRVLSLARDQMRSGNPAPALRVLLDAEAPGWSPSFSDAALMQWHSELVHSAG